MYLTLNSVIVRIAFRIVFFILSIYLGAFGSLCNRLHTKLRLLEDRQIPVADAAGWMQGSAILEPIIKTRAVPNGKWYIVMILVFTLVKVNDLLTNTIKISTVPCMCEFDIGAVLTTNGTLDFRIPPSNAWTGFQSEAAQWASLGNGCKQGIYRKFNSDSQFCAVPSDIIGHWNCTQVGEDRPYSYGTTLEEIKSDLLKNDLIYPRSSSYYDGNSDVDFAQFVAWSSSTADNSSEVWDVKASIDLNALETESKIMHSMHCKLHGGEQVMKIAKGVESRSALYSWSAMYQMYMYDGFGSMAWPDPENKLAWYLNSLIMVAGCSDIYTSSAPKDYPKQGCVLEMTDIPTYLLGLLGLTVLSCGVMTILAVLLWFRLRAHRGYAQVNHMPVDLWTWMAQAVGESNAELGGRVNPVNPRELHSWNLELGDGPTARIQKKGVVTHYFGESPKPGFEVEEVEIAPLPGTVPRPWY